MIEVIVLIVAFVVLLIASITDLKTREVPDWISFTTIAFGFSLRGIWSVLAADPSFIIEGILGFAVMWVIGCLMYYSGQWGGGDAKILMGLGALFGITPTLSSQFAFTYLYHLLLAGALYGIVWILYLFIRNHKKCLEYIRIHGPSRKITLCILSGAVVYFIGVFTEPLLIVVGLILLALYFIWIVTLAVESTVMIKTVPVSSITEGEWIHKEVHVAGTLICGPNDLGVTREQIKALVHHKVTTVVIREGIPFIPSFLLALVAAYVLGDWMSVLLQHLQLLL